MLVIHDGNRCILISEKEFHLPEKCHAKLIKTKDKYIAAVYEGIDLTTFGEPIIEKNAKDYGLIPIEKTVPEQLVIIDMRKEEIPYNRTLKLAKGLPYKGDTPAEALRKDGIKAYVTLYPLLSVLKEEHFKKTIPAIRYACQDWLEEISTKDPWGINLDDIKEFISCSNQIIPEMIQEILQKAGYSSLIVFLEKGEELVIRSAYASIVQRLKTFQN